MAVDYKVADITESTAAGFESALDAFGLDDWILIHVIQWILPERVPLVDNEITYRCFFRK
jgi:hypothetical protein